MDNINEVTDKCLKAGFEGNWEGQVSGSQSLQQEGKVQIFSGSRSGLEDDFTSWDEKQQVWQMIAKLGGSIQDYQGYLR